MRFLYCWFLEIVFGFLCIGCLDGARLNLWMIDESDSWSLKAVSSPFVLRMDLEYFCMKFLSLLMLNCCLWSLFLEVDRKLWLEMTGLSRMLV